MHIETQVVCAWAPLKTRNGFVHNAHMARHYLRAWRKQSGKTLEQVAEHLHMHHSQLSRIERMQQPYNQALLEALADLYMCDVVDLLIRDPGEPSNMWSLWEHAKPAERQQIVAITEALLNGRTGTTG